MKKVAVVFVLALCLLSLNAMAGEWTGHISDSKCGAAHSDGSEKSINCVKGCVKGGAAPVFVTADKKVLKIDEGSKEKVMEHLGHKVTVTGSLDGDTLKIDTVKM
jgi:hypothetical protein